LNVQQVQTSGLSPRDHHHANCHHSAGIDPSPSPLRGTNMKTTKRKAPGAAKTEPDDLKEWLVIDGAKVIYRGEDCIAAIAVIEKRRLPSTALWQSSRYIAEVMRDFASKAATRTILKPFRVMDDNGFLLYASDTKWEAWAFRNGHGSGNVFKLQSNMKMKPVKLPPLPRSGD
ncbi:MAG: hypothetical protein JWN70_6909, partial [Planctomycetaceae bacterium]|nr:hypothetical protein [Planctomycetaceae bacterium]